MKIGELSQATGVDVETIRYYEKSGLLPAPARLANGYREYGTPHLERLAFVRHCRALDLPLAEVQRLLDFVDQPGGDCGDINQLIDGQLARVRARLTSLQALSGNWRPCVRAVILAMRPMPAAFWRNWCPQPTARPVCAMGQDSEGETGLFLLF